VDKPVVEKTFTPPLLVRRIFAAVAVVAVVVRLIVEPSLRNTLWVVALCPLFVAVVVQPKGLRDGRSRAWEQRHPVFLGAGAALFSGIATYLFLSWLFDGWWSVVIAVVLGLAYGVSVVVLGRRRYRAG
jgi:hypothetical protein